MSDSSQTNSVSSINVSVDTQFNGSSDFILTDPDRKSCQLCSKKTIYKRLPILSWIADYSVSDAIGDLIAGITGGMTVIPQGLAYSSIAGLPTQYGLYGAFTGCFVYVIFGSCKAVTIGSTAVASLLVGQAAGGNWQRAALLTFLTGMLELLMGIFRLGFLVDFVSEPVNAGFTSAVTLIIFTSQVKNVLNVKASGRSFLEIWSSIFRNITNFHLPDALLGLTCITFLLFMRYLGNLSVGPKDQMLRRSWHKFINKCLWILGISRIGVVVVVCATAAWYLEQNGTQLFTLIGFIPQGVPKFAIPSFSIPAIRANDTNGKEIITQQGERFMDIISDMGSAFIVIPLIALLENISACRAFAKGKPIDATQEIFTVAIANICTSFFQGYRVNGGLSRSAVNQASGARTQMSNFYIGLVAVLSLTYLTPYLYFIPKATLGAIIMAAVIFATQYNAVLPIWRSKKSDLIPGLGTLIACLVLPLQIGIVVGIAINMVFILYYSARPKINLKVVEITSEQSFLMVTPDRCLIFPSVEFVRSVINKSGMKTTLPVVVDCTFVYGADFTAAKAVAVMVKDFNSRNQKIVFYNLKASVSQVFVGVETNLILCYTRAELELELASKQN